MYAYSSFWDFFAFMSLLVGMLGSVVAGLNNRTALAVISGIAILVFSLNIYRFSDYVWALILFFAGSMNFIVAFVTYTKKSSSKLRVFYFIPTAIITFLLFTSLKDLNNEQFMDNDALFLYLLLMFVKAGIVVMGLNNIYWNMLPRPPSD